MEQNFAASLNAKKGPGFGEGRKHAVGGHMFGLHHGMMSYLYHVLKVQKNVMILNMPII
jgi:hypothetical protein